MYCPLINCTGLQFYIHNTNPDNIPAIHEQGLVAGHPDGHGVGDAESARPCAEGVFVRSPQGSGGCVERAATVYIALDAQAQPPGPDPHNPRTNACLIFQELIHPVRRVGSLGDAKGPYSFTVEDDGALTPRTRDGLAVMMRNAGKNIPAEDVASEVRVGIKATFPLSHGLPDE